MRQPRIRRCGAVTHSHLIGSRCRRHGLYASRSRFAAQREQFTEDGDAVASLVSSAWGATADTRRAPRGESIALGPLTGCERQVS
jgi:hypothetical protein